MLTVLVTESEIRKCLNTKSLTSKLHLKMNGASWKVSGCYMQNYSQ